MQLNKKLNLIHKILKRKKEYPFVELQITNYNNSNFYLCLLYNRIIDKFKVLYIPIDAVEDNKIADDLAELSDGKLQMTDNIVRLMATRLEMNYRSKNAGPGNRTNMPNNRNNNYKRKY